MEVLRFDDLVEGTFLRRVNRFLAEVEVKERVVPVHLRETGRAGELLVKNARVLLLPRKTPKTDYTLIAVERRPYGWVFLNPGYHSRITELLIEKGAFPEVMGAVTYTPEVKIGKSRIDFLLLYEDGAVPLEVKGCTLFDGDVALFPDAPTERGRRHVEELSAFSRSMLWFLVMSDRVRFLSFHHENDPRFAHALVKGLDRVHVVAPTFRFDGQVLHLSGRIPFLFPVTDESRLVLHALKELEESYNESFSPEGAVFVNGLLYDERPRLWAVFRSKNDDYIDDFSAGARELGFQLQPLKLKSIGRARVVEFLIT